MIPYCNLNASHDSFLPELFKEFQQLFNDCDFIGAGSKKVAAFEADFAALMNCRHALGVASGTDALLLPLHAMGVGAGDEVIMPAFGFIATADVAIRLGAKPVFVDVDPVTFNMDPVLVEKAVTPKTKVICPVHLFGQACDMDAIMDIAARHRLAVLEDVAQACGSTHKGRRLGTIGDFGAFSFYPTKNLGGAGDGGIITTNCDDHAETIRRFRDHGRTPQGTFECIGYNSRLDTIQALYLHHKLRELDEALAERIENARLYATLLAGQDVVVTPEVPPEDDLTHTFNYYTVRVTGNQLGLASTRDRLQNYLKEKGVQTAIYYRECMHTTPALKFLGYKPEDFPVSLKAVGEVLSLPNWPGMKKKEVEYVAGVVLEFVANNPVHKSR